MQYQDGSSWQPVLLTDSGDTITGYFGPWTGFDLSTYPSGTTTNFRASVDPGVPTGNLTVAASLDPVDSNGVPTEGSPLATQSFDTAIAPVTFSTTSPSAFTTGADPVEYTSTLANPGEQIKGASYSFALSGIDGLKATQVHIEYKMPDASWFELPLSGAIGASSSITGSFGPMTFTVPSDAPATSTFSVRIDAGAPAGALKSSIVLSKDGKTIATDVANIAVTAPNSGNSNGSGDNGGSTGSTTPATPAVSTEVKAGGTASSSKATTPSATNPVIASVTSPVAGTVSFTESTSVKPQAGFSMLDQGFVIEAPQATAAKPLALDFKLNMASIPAGTSLANVMVFRDGVPVAECAKPNATTADPDPCVAKTSTASGVGSITVLSSHASTWTFGTVDVDRIAGANRYATAADIAAQFAKTAAFTGNAVILANGTDAKNGVDALAANFLAGAKGAPILLTGSTALAPEAKSALGSLFAGKTGAITVYAMGKTDAVSQAARDAAAAAVKAAAKGATVTVVEVAGSNRFATSADAAAKAGAAVKSYDLGKGAGKTAFLASGLVNADALAAGGASAKAGVPVLLTGAGATLPTEVSAAVKTLGITNVVILGGTDRVSKSVEDSLTAAGVHTLRLAGSGSQARFDTAALINGLEFKAASAGGFGVTAGDTAYLANGLAGFPDALAVGPLASATSAPLLTVPATALPTSTGKFLTATAGITTVVALGKTDRIGNAVVIAAQGNLK